MAPVAEVLSLKSRSRRIHLLDVFPCRRTVRPRRLGLELCLAAARGPPLFKPDTWRAGPGGNLGDICKDALGAHEQGIVRIRFLSV